MRANRSGSRAVGRPGSAGSRPYRRATPADSCSGSAFPFPCGSRLTSPSKTWTSSPSRSTTTAYSVPTSSSVARGVRRENPVAARSSWNTTFPDRSAAAESDSTRSTVGPSSVTAGPLSNRTRATPFRSRNSPGNSRDPVRSGSVGASQTQSAACANVATYRGGAWEAAVSMDGPGDRSEGRGFQRMS